MPPPARHGRPDHPGSGGRSARGGTPGKGAPRNDRRDATPRDSGQRDSGQRRGPQPGPAPARDGRPARTPPRSPRPPAAARPAPRTPRVQEPLLPDDVDARDLDRAARAELRSLPESLADKVARHLVTAGRILDDDPQRAREHAWFARRLAPRLAVVREAAGITAYTVGDYAAALAELRAVRRMTGDVSALAVMADCERGLGRPERALALARDPDAKKLDPATKVELGIVASGARRDRGEYDAAVVALQGPALDSDRLQPWTARLWYAYAAALADAGRTDEALRWFESVAAIDEFGETDAAERAAELGGDAAR